MTATTAIQMTRKDYLLTMVSLAHGWANEPVDGAVIVAEVENWGQTVSTIDYPSQCLEDALPAEMERFARLNDSGCKRPRDCEYASRGWCPICEPAA